MTEPHAKPVQLKNQVDGVLQDYLDQLLITATEISEPIRTSKSEVKSVTPQPEVPSVQIASVKVNTTAEIQTEAVLEAEVPSKTQLTSPDWRNNQGVECLIFKVAGLKLAIPLALLGGVYPVTDKITPLIGQVPWSLGVWAGEEFKLTIIDSAQLMMPERNISLKNTDYSFFIQLDRSPWALACQEICDTVTLVYDSIKWRGDASKRPWLAGTVIDEMCALVDVPQIMTLLEDRCWPSS